MNPTRPIIIAAVLGLAGCSADPKETIFNEQNTTMASILNSTTTPTSIYTQKAHSRSESINYNGGYFPDQNVFRELDNPTLFLYIEPHVTARGTYIPGLTVPVKRYANVEFALPGEQ